MRPFFQSASILCALRPRCAACTLACLIAAPACAAWSQSPLAPPAGADTTQLRKPPVRLPRTVVSGTRPPVSRLGDDSAGHVYTGATTTLIVPQALNADLVTAGYRDVLGMVPGANIAETRGRGFPSDGIAFRGLEPRQSVEVNMRQNGVNIAGDLYGYPETYYSPPLEAVDHVEVVRGASGLEYGPQFGGMVDFVLKDGAPDTPPTITIRQTSGSFGLYDGFASVGGGSGKWTYYGFGNYTGAAGWRPNGNYEQGGGYGSLTYRASSTLET